MQGRPRSINYVYFAALLIIFSAIHIYHGFLIQNATLLQRTFYIIHAQGQCLLEIGVLIVLGYFLSRGFLQTCFIVFTFLLLLLHLIDFILVRIMGMTIWYVLDLIRAESWENFMEMLYATHISIGMWMVTGVVAIILPILGVALYRGTEKISNKRPLKFSYSVVGMSLLVTVVFLSLFDFKICKIATPADDGHFLAVLPWKTTLFSSPYPEMKLKQTLPAKPPEKEFLALLKNVDLQPPKKPNIFLFVIESLREDFLVPDTAPFLAAFKEENHLSSPSFSAANGTQTSWFSIFHSVYPFYWGTRNPDEWHSGSLPLQILKKAGYKIRLYSSSRLGYYQMDQRIFGDHQALADDFRIFGENEHENYKKDALCMEALGSDLERYPEGNLFIVFLESTHFGYSWPPEKTLHPAPETINYLHIACSNDTVEGVKNRYRNAIHFIDSLMGQFFMRLHQLPQGKESVVVLTGDHGEEFFEQGRIFHASNLNAMQTRVPIYYKLGASTPLKPTLSSHLDIFPTLLHYILGDDKFSSWFDGDSLLSPRTRPFVISARYNASRAPCEFLIYDGQSQLVARFRHRDIFSSRTLDLISHRVNGESLEIDPARIQSDFKESLESLFRK